MSRIASYFSKADRKKLFFDYLKLIGILEIVIFIVVALWATDDKYHRVYSPFPWQEYLFVAFAFPIVITFLMGIMVTGFNYFLGEDKPPRENKAADDQGHQLEAVIRQIRRLPYLAILFLLLVTLFALFNMNHIMAWLGSLGYNAFLLLSYGLAGLGVIVAVYMMFFLFFKYRLNHKQLRYQYYSQISDKFGLIILDDHTVLYKDGNLLVQGGRWKRPQQVGTAASEVELLSPEAQDRPHLPALKP
jgi:hypothetical protein